MNYEMLVQPNALLDSAVEQQLTLLRQRLDGQDYPGYPAFSERLVLSAPELAAMPQGIVTLPSGPWEIPPVYSPGTATTLELKKQLELQQSGYELDANGQALHPWFRQMVTDPTLGVVTGKGAYWRWGPNHTVDPIVVQNGNILIIKRSDTGSWALPGGYVDHGELASQAGPREVMEETGICLPSNVVGEVVYAGPVADTRATAHAWPETTALLYQLEPTEQQTVPRGMDDAIDAAWVPLEILEAEPLLFGSHSYLLALAMQKLGA